MADSVSYTHLDVYKRQEEGRITQEDALRNADSINELRLRFKLHSKNAGAKTSAFEKPSLSLHVDEPEEPEDDSMSKF